MKLNMHIILEDLGECCCGWKLTQNEKLDLFGIRFLWNLHDKPDENVIYIATKGEYELCDCRDKLHACILTNMGANGTLQDPCQNYILIKEAYNIVDIFVRVQEIFERYNRWEYSMLELITTSGDLKKMLDVGREVLGNPLALFDTNMICLAISGEEAISANDPVWKDIVAFGHTTLELTPFLRKDVKNIYEPIRKARNSFIYQFPEINCNCLHCNIFRNEIHCGCICMTEITSPLTKRTTSLANHFRDLLASSLERSSMYRTRNGEFGQLMLHILDGKNLSDQYIDVVLGKFGWVSQDYYRVIVLINEIETVVDMEPNSFYFTQIFPSCQIYRTKDQLLLVQNISTPEGANIPDGVEALLNQLGRYGGVSDTFEGFGKVSLYYQQALTACKYGKRQKSGGRRLFHYRDFEIDHIINMVSEHTSPETLCIPEIVELHRMDAANGTEYVRTLYTFLSCGKNLVKAAKQLFIHRNTLVYRMDRITDIIGESLLDDSSRTLSCMLSCRIIEHLSQQSEQLHN